MVRLVLIVSLLFIQSCSMKAPEMKSPCVAADSDSAIHAINPCIRRPVNTWLS